jgi:hypothetical protein
MAVGSAQVMRIATSSRYLGSKSSNRNTCREVSEITYSVRARNARIRVMPREYYLNDLEDEALQPRTIAVYI